jgi:hypothetical protein
MPRDAFEMRKIVVSLLGCQVTQAKRSAYAGDHLSRGAQQAEYAKSPGSRSRLVENYFGRFASVSQPSL